MRQRGLSAAFAAPLVAVIACSQTMAEKAPCAADKGDGRPCIAEPSCAGAGLCASGVCVPAAPAPTAARWLSDGSVVGFVGSSPTHVTLVVTSSSHPGAAPSRQLSVDRFDLTGRRLSRVALDDQPVFQRVIVVDVDGGESAIVTAASKPSGDPGTTGASIRVHWYGAAPQPSADPWLDLGTETLLSGADLCGDKRICVVTQHHDPLNEPRLRQLDWRAGSAPEPVTLPSPASGVLIATHAVGAADGIVLAGWLRTSSGLSSEGTTDLANRILLARYRGNGNLDWTTQLGTGPGLAAPAFAALRTDAITWLLYSDVLWGYQRNWLLGVSEDGKETSRRELDGISVASAPVFLAKRAGPPIWLLRNSIARSAGASIDIWRLTGVIGTPLARANLALALDPGITSARPSLLATLVDGELLAVANLYSASGKPSGAHVWRTDRCGSLDCVAAAACEQAH